MKLQFPGEICFHKEVELHSPGNRLKSLYIRLQHINEFFYVLIKHYHIAAGGGATEFMVKLLKGAYLFNALVVVFEKVFFY